jgi:hypothetical protein
MPKKRRELGFPCMKCGRNFGSRVRRTLFGNQVRRVAVGDKLTTIESRYKIKKDVHGNEYQTPIEPKLHPYKYLTGLFMQLDPSTRKINEKHPVINPPPATSAQRSKFRNSMTGMAFDELIKSLGTFCRMIPIVEERYPILFAKIDEDFAAGLRFVRQIIAYERDDRYKRSFFEWLEICHVADEKSTNAASREYYGRSLKGERVHLSSTHVKKKCVEIETLAYKGLTYWPMFEESMDLVMSLIGSDHVLLNKYNEIERQYNGEEVLPNPDSKEKHNSRNRYIYYYIRHYDANLYLQQKENFKKGIRKSKPDGMLECGPFKLSDFPAG